VSVTDRSRIDATNTRDCLAYYSTWCGRRRSQ